MGTLNWYGEMGNGQVGTAKWETARWETAKWDTAKWAVAKLNMMGDKASPCRTPFPISNGLFRSMFILILDELVLHNYLKTHQRCYVSKYFIFL
jgi:hypothetical protein